MAVMRKMAYLAVFVITLGIVFLSGCTTISDFLEKSNNPKVDVDPDILATYFEGPRVKPGVGLAISVAAVGTTGNSQQYVVDAEGYISMDLIGQVKCDGLTLVSLQQKITTAYKEFFLEPHVSVTFVYQNGMVSPWGTVTVLGEVGRPGPVDMPSTMDLRLTRALQLAGGTTAIGDKTRILVTRCDKDGTQTKTRVNLVEIGEEGRPDKDMALKAGDVVWVPVSWY